MEKVDIINPNIFEFTQPKLNLGQKVRLRNGYIGYVAGMIFYSDTATWSYAIYLPDHVGGGIYEVWFSTEEIMLV